MNAIRLFRLAALTFLVFGNNLNAATFTYSYDVLNRLTNATYSDGSSEAYSHDSAGNRVSRITTAATINTDTTAPATPTNLGTNTFTQSKLSISWNPATDTGGSGMFGYQVFLNGSLVATTTDPFFLLSGLMPDTQYCLSVAAFDRSGNVSGQSSPICVTTPIFQAPLLSPISLSGGEFHIGISGGTPGPYEVFVSSNLSDWQHWSNVSLPMISNVVDIAVTNLNRNFYRLQWSTNSP